MADNSQLSSCLIWPSAKERCFVQVYAYSSEPQQEGRHAQVLALSWDISERLSHFQSSYKIDCDCYYITVQILPQLNHASFSNNVFLRVLTNKSFECKSLHQSLFSGYSNKDNVLQDFPFLCSFFSVSLNLFSSSLFSAAFSLLFNTFIKF